MVRDTATSSSGKQRRHRQGNGDVITVTSGIATISQQSDAFATILEDRPKQHVSAWGLRTKLVTMAAPMGPSANRVKKVIATVFQTKFPEISRDLPRDLPRDFPRDLPRELPRDLPRDFFGRPCICCKVCHKSQALDFMTL